MKNRDTIIHELLSQILFFGWKKTDRQQKKKKEVNKIGFFFCCLSVVLHLKKTICRKRLCITVSVFFITLVSIFSLIY